jgi:DNA (cytosine-5)-methyltransferase 1
MKILNLYAGIGGNRKLWGDEHEVTAVEYDTDIAKIYQDHFPKDTMIVGDAHQYLLDHYSEFDFIWSSPPCPTHSKMMLTNHLNPYKDNSRQIAHGGGKKLAYPEMELYQEIILLDTYFKGHYAVENVVGYYEPLIVPQKVGKHYIWANFTIEEQDFGHRGHHLGLEGWQERKGFDLSSYKGIDKRKILRNCTEPELGEHILNSLSSPN